MQERPLWGEWAGMRDVEGKRYNVHFLFYPDGRSLFVMPSRQRTGKYTIQGSSIRVEVPDDAVREGAFRIEGDLLTVPGLGGTQGKFRRY